MINWFEIFADRLTAIEEGQREIRTLLIHSPSQSDSDPFGDFKWLESICSGIPASTLRIKSAAGEIPGVVKFGKRVLYEKSAVLNWLHSQVRVPIDDTGIRQQVEKQFDNQIANTRKGERRQAA